MCKEGTPIPDGVTRPLPPPAPPDKRGHLTQKELNEQITRCARVVVPCQTGWVCPKCGSVMAPHMSVCPNCAVQTMPSYPQYPGYPPEVTCGLRPATREEHISAGGHQSAGPR